MPLVEAGAGAGLDSPAQRSSAYWLCTRIQAPWYKHALCSLGSGHWAGAYKALSAPAQTRISDFMNELVAKNPDQEIHVVLDNLNTHKPKQDRWLKAHPQVVGGKSHTRSG